MQVYWQPSDRPFRELFFGFTPYRMYSLCCCAWPMWPWLCLPVHFGNLCPLGRTLACEIRMQPDELDASCLLCPGRSVMKEWLYLSDSACFSRATESVRKACASNKPIYNLRFSFSRPCFLFDALPHVHPLCVVLGPCCLGLPCLAAWEMYSHLGARWPTRFRCNLMNLMCHACCVEAVHA